ncbi:MAG: dihydrofolate reductase family protein [Ekhidna sp.]
MRNIVYYVATSLDGYIAGEEGDISMFAHEGDLVDQYLYDLESFDTVIMGRNTYEFGYRYGLKPGDPAYAHMEHFIFSDSLKLASSHDQVNVVSKDLDKVRELKQEVGSDIYLCGGGMFAGWLLENELIDIIKLKVNPVVIGGGVKLFGDYPVSREMEVTSSRPYDNGRYITTFKVKN